MRDWLTQAHDVGIAYFWDELMHCTAQEVEYFINLKQIKIRDDGSMLKAPYYGLVANQESVNAYLLLSENETPDIQIKHMKVIPKIGDIVTTEIVNSWEECLTV